MAEKNSSSIKSNHNRGQSIGQGWEEAKGEFYQEAFRTASSSGEPDSNKLELTAWEAILPSQRTKIIDTRTWGRATCRRPSTRTFQRSNSVTAADIELETMPDLAEGFADEEETWDQLQRIRSMPINMEKKLELKAELMRAPTFRVRGLELLHLRRRQLWRQFKNSTWQFFSCLSPWKSSLQSIETNFGTGVASYFLVIRWLFILNISISILMAVFIIIPWEIGQRSCSKLYSNATSCPESILDGCTLYNNNQGNISCEDEIMANISKTEECWQEYRSSLSSNFRDNTSQPLLLIQDVLQGTGWLELTFSFYGYYHPAHVIWADARYFSISLGYVLTVLFVLLLSLVCIIKSVASGLKHNIGLGKAWLHKYSDLVFASWDFCIDKANVADQKKKTILNALRTAMADQRFAEQKAFRTVRIKIRLFIVRATVNILVLLCLGGCGYIIHLVTDFSLAYDSDSWPEEPYIHFKDLVVTVVAFLPAILITALNFMVPILFGALIRSECYSETFKRKFTLIRTVFLRLSCLLVLMMTLYGRLKASVSPDSHCGVDDWMEEESDQVVTKCWETQVGQQLYRLCILDTLVTLTTTLLVQFPLTLILRRSVSPSGRMRCVGYPEFDLEANILDLVYSQCICWMGMFYCPILPVATIMKNGLVFYVKYFSLSVYSLPPSLLHSASSTTNLFMNVLLVSLLSCLLPLAYHVTYLTPSPSCGPFRTFNTVWSVISQEISSSPEFLRQALSFFCTAGFLVPAIVILLIGLFYYRSKAASHRVMTNSFKQQLAMEGQDKQYLLARLVSVSKQQQPALN